MLRREDYTGFRGKPEGKTQLKKRRRKWNGNVKRDRKVWTAVFGAGCCDSVRAVVNVVMKFGFP